MRPEHFCPGNTSAANRSEWAQTTFNEAGAFLPRKPPRSCRAGRPARCSFNEAGAFLPRKPGAGC